MIKLVIVTDDNNIIGYSNLDNYAERAANWSPERIEEINTIFAGDHMIVGRTTLPLCLDSISYYQNFYVLTNHPDLYKDTNDQVIFTNDIKMLVDRYQHSEETLIVGGGKATWEILLPYASEIVVCVTNDVSMGDIVFDSWKHANLKLVNERTWKGGTTSYYQL